MVLHRSLGHREYTRDVDYVHRAFAADYASTGSQQEAEARLRRCIAGTAAARGLGVDWMNAAPDVALPMARDDYGRTHDPVYTSFLADAGKEDYTVFSAPGLQLIAVNWAWAIAFKLVRYEKNDSRDVQAMIRMLSHTRGGRWDASFLEQWITTTCWPMGYSSYAPPQKEQLRRRIDHAVRLAYSSI
ncbi:hypothetical protein OF83DRAFT_1065383 [Amylostereum chailletii]|nr:hypothetical protein OF83DRAFT_1065383 [Amylostereum chailletii]